MGFFSKLTNLFSRGGRDDNLLLQGIEHAKAKRPEKAIEVYNSLLASRSISQEVRARALYNRSIAYSATREDDKALADLQEVAAMPNVPANVQTAARERLIRVKKRAE